MEFVETYEDIKGMVPYVYDNFKRYMKNAYHWMTRRRLARMQKTFTLI